MPSLEKFASELSSIIPAANAGAQPLLSAFAPESTIFDCPASEGGRFSADTAFTAFNAAVTIDNSIPAGRVRVTGVASTTIQRGISVQIQEVVQ